MDDRQAYPPAAESPALQRGTPVADPTGRPPLLESEALLQGHSTVEILHRGVYYRLQATRQGKLILTK